MPRAAWLAVGAVAGSLAVGAAGPLVPCLAGASAIALIVAARLAGFAEVPRRWAPIALGVLAIGLRGVASPAPAPAELPHAAGAGPWVGTVETVAPLRHGSRPATVRLDDPAVLVAATLPWYPPVVPGDRVAIGGRISPPPESAYGEYLRGIGAVGTLRAETLGLQPAEGSIGRTIETWRRAAAAGLQRSIPEPEAGLAAGVLIGLRDLVDRDLAAAFTTAGASHVVAISGWNIAIVASTLGALAGTLRRRRRAVLTAVAIAAYVAFVGPSASVVRAGVMAGVALLAREAGRPGSAAAALGWACTALLLVDPAWVDDAGFRLSALATAGILAWGTGLTRRLAGTSPGRARRLIADVLGVSFAAQAATMPIVLLDFGRLSLVAPVVNLLVVPIVPPAMAAGALALVVGVGAGAGLPAALATLAGLPAWALYAAMVGAVRAGAGMPLASVELASPWDAVAAVASALLIVVPARWGSAIVAGVRRTRDQAGRGTGPTAHRPKVVAHARGKAPPPARAPRIAAGALASATVALALAITYRPDGAVHVVVLDVGQGDAILVEGDRGGRMVIDGGPDPSRLLVALDERLPPWDRRIDILVLTHPHEDHVAGLAPVLERYRVGRVYEPGMIGPGPGYEAWTAAFANSTPPRFRLSTGDRLTLDSIRFRVLWPDANRVADRPPDGGTSINNVSIVLLGEVGSERFLLTGDVEQGVDPELIARGLPPLDLLKVAHHGSRTATTEAFLAQVRPRVAVVSAGAGNPYGHPAPVTMERLHELAGRTYRTDTDGSVDVTLDGQAVRVRTSGPRAAAALAAVPPAVLPAPAPPGPIQATQVAFPRTAAVATLFQCAVAAVIRPGSSAPVAPAVVRGPVAPEAPGLPVARGGPLTSADAQILARLPDASTEPQADPAEARGYHREDGTIPVLGDRGAARNRSPGLFLGRRRVRPRRGHGRLPQRSRAVPGGCTGALAPGRRSRRSRPPPGRAP